MALKREHSGVTLVILPKEEWEYESTEDANRPLVWVEVHSRKELNADRKRGQVRWMENKKPSYGPPASHQAHV